MPDSLYRCTESKPAWEATWSRKPLFPPTQTIIRVESPDGDDYSVAVIREAALTDTYPAAFARKALTLVREPGVLKTMFPSYPNATLIESGVTTLSQQDAVYYIVDFSAQALGESIAFRTVNIQTKHNDMIYTLTFRTPKAFYDKYVPRIKSLALAFQLHKLSMP